ncbi:MAG: hypothetical protein M1475_02425 [Actinobacteria bacterium]|nr:hypothetical protein [Actinomycetota bacterium]MCL6087245.1 hypothetical protein [Actinomycetota bacterium]
MAKRKIIKIDEDKCSCFALTNIVKQAIASSEKIIPFADVNISIKGKKILG